MEGNLLYSGIDGGGSAWNWYNIARDLSRVNAKNEEVTDRDGHVFGYLCNVTLEGTGPSVLSVVAASNSWKMRNAVRKTHFLREHMFSEAGVTKSEKGKYGQTIRMHLQTNMVDPAGYKEAQFFFPQGSIASTAFNVGEWTYSRLASSPSFDVRDITQNMTLPLVDTYDIAICGKNIETTEPTLAKTFDTIGMIHSYNLDRMEQVPDATDDTKLINPNNPFAMLRSQSVTGGEIVDIASDQELEEPPYDVADDGHSIYPLLKQVTQVNATESTRKFQIFLPAGLMAIYSTNSMAASLLNVEVVAKVLCKDMA
ncbi:MAG: hypothetical protein [Circular genetic element sp.]|nr:MAG: hypothetical protein [Circular genetic element sp.]